MTIAQRIGSIAANAEQAMRSKQFAHVARYLALGKGAAGAALVEARAARAEPEITRIFEAQLKSATTPLGTAQLAEFRSLADAFVASLSQSSAFDRMLPHMVPVPLRMRIAAATVGMTGASVLEAKPTPISSLTLENVQLAERKVVAIMAIDRELARLGPADLFEKELRRAVVRQTDTEFVSIIASGVTQITSAGTTAANVRADLRTAFASIVSDEASKFYVLVNSATAKNLATMGDASGAAAFAEMTPSGGTLCGATAIVTAGVGDDFVVVDAAGLAASGGTIEVSGSQHAVLHMDSAPDDPPSAATVMRSLFQANEAALKAERIFGVERFRNAVAVVAGYDGSP